jgi:hypothetical protein
MSKIRKAAKGAECQIRIPGVCNYNPETTVLAHLNGAGMALKANDIHGAFACSDCHNEVDRRTRHIDMEAARLAHLEGVIRTQKVLLRIGLIL